MLDLARLQEEVLRAQLLVDHGGGQEVVRGVPQADVVGGRGLELKMTRLMRMRKHPHNLRLFGDGKFPRLGFSVQNAPREYVLVSCR